MYSFSGDPLTGESELFTLIDDCSGSPTSTFNFTNFTVTLDVYVGGGCVIRRFRARGGTSPLYFAHGYGLDPFKSNTPGNKTTANTITTELECPSTGTMATGTTASFKVV